MKREYEAPVQKAINDLKGELNGYTWSITEDGLVWSYMNVEFKFVWNPESHILKSVDEHGNTFICLWVEDCDWSDCKTLEEAYYMLTQSTIRKANYLY